MITNNNFSFAIYADMLYSFETTLRILYHGDHSTFEDFRAQRCFPSWLKISYLEDGNIIDLPLWDEEDLIQMYTNDEEVRREIIEYEKINPPGLHIYRHYDWGK